MLYFPVKFNCRRLNLHRIQLLPTIVNCATCPDRHCQHQGWVGTEEAKSEPILGTEIPTGINLVIITKIMIFWEKWPSNNNAKTATVSPKRQWGTIKHRHMLHLSLSQSPKVFNIDPYLSMQFNKMVSIWDHWQSIQYNINQSFKYAVE